MSIDFTDFINALEDDEFDERPVDLEEFVTSKQYLGLPPLSKHQYTIIRMGTQIYKESSLIKLYGEEEGVKRHKLTMKELVLALGKASGKDYVSTIICARIVYLLLCLKDPSRYYDAPSNDAIDIINVAVNSGQAKNVFFKGFKTKIKDSPWFVGKYKPLSDSIEFDKQITVHSGHSEREAWEGFNLFAAVLDEISAFNIDNTTGAQAAKTAGDIYKMFRGSVDSRFEAYGKLVLLSFPRFKGDFITTHYESVIADKEVKKRHHTFKIHDDLPDGYVDNEFTIEWEEDHIVKYTRPKVFALRRPTWEVNPTKNIEMFKDAFLVDPADALGRFAAMPPDMIDAYFPSREKIEKAFSSPRSNIDGGFLDNDFQYDETKEYFIHTDLAQLHDRCAVAMAHIEGYSRMTYGGTEILAPRVVVDFVRYWEPIHSSSVDFGEVRDFIISIKRRVPTLKLVTFDHWSSYDIMQQLSQHNINTDNLSLAKKHYDDFKLAVQEERVYGPHDDKLIQELVQLRIIRDKVDHPRRGFKDISDATCGAIFNAIRFTNRQSGQEVQVHTIEDLPKEDNRKKYADDVIQAPKREMPPELNDFLLRMI